MKAAIYARVSTNDCKCPSCGHAWKVKGHAEDNPLCPKCGTPSDRRQESKNQLVQLREFCDRNGWTVYREFVDHESGAKADRPEFQGMLTDASKRKFDVLLFWALDRLTREGTLETLQYLNRLSSYGVCFRSYSEAYLDSCGVWKDAIIGILATLAKQERIRLSERVRSGLERAKANGKRLGPPKMDLDVDRIKELRSAGWAYLKIAEELDVSVGTVYRYANS